MFLLTKIFSIILPKNETNNTFIPPNSLPIRILRVSLLNFDQMVSYDNAVKEKGQGMLACYNNNSSEKQLECNLSDATPKNIC